MDERQRKIEAGKSKWAEFKKRKSRGIKSKSSSSAVSPPIDEQNSAVNTGESSKILKESPQLIIKPVESEKVIESKVLPVEVTINTHSTTNNDFLMDSSSPPENLHGQPNLLPLNIERQSLQESNSIESFTLESNTDQSEISSSSDNSTVTGSSSNSKSSSTEKESSVKSFPVSIPSVQLISHSHVEDGNDNRPDEQKAFESIPTEEKEQDLLVEEIFVSGENILDSVVVISEKCSLEKQNELKSDDMLIDQDKNYLSMKIDEEPKSNFSENINTFSSLLSLTEDEDEHAAFLNADDSHFSSVFDHYQMKIKKYQEAIQKRDSVIHKLSRTLESTMNANQAAHSDGNTQVEKLKEEFNLLQLKMKETAELLEKQKLKNGNIEIEDCACQTEAFQLIKCDTAIQVETSFSSLLQFCDLNESSFFELFIKKFSINSDSLQNMVQKLGELLTIHFSHTQIKELMTLLKDNVGFQQDLEITYSSSSTISDIHSPEKLDPSAILKKINSLNMVAKLIESLISISSGSANSTFSDFSPSKFQSFFLRRLHSMESGDILHDMSESESVISDFNYAEVETPASNKPIIDPISPIEKLRQKNLSEDFSLVTDFLQDEMDKIRSSIPSISCGPQGDGFEFLEKVDEKECVPEAGDTVVESDQQKIFLHLSKLDTRLKNLKFLDKELQNVQQFPHRLSLDSDTMTLSEDNIMMEELPLSCVSLLSLTDSEYKGDNIPTDSETNFSRKVSLDMSRSMQEREFCPRCERNADLLREKYENDIMNLKDQLEKTYSTQKKTLLESMKKLKFDVCDLKAEKETLKSTFSEQIEILCSENTLRLKQLSEKYDEELERVKASQNKTLLEKEELEVKYKEVYQKLAFSDQKLCAIFDEKSENEITLQNQIADLIQEHEQDLEMIRLDNEAKLSREKKLLEDNYTNVIQGLKKMHEEEIGNLRIQIKKEFDEKEQNLLNEHSKTINMIEAAHCDESAVYQKKIEQLLEEKCELLSKTTQEYETILNKNHRALEILCKRLMSKIKTEKERILNESIKSGVDLDVSLSALEQLNNNLENGLLKFLNQNYFINTNNEEFCPDETEYLPIEMNFPVSEKDMPPDSKSKQSVYAVGQSEEQKSGSKSSLDSHGEYRAAPSESSLDSDDLFTIQAEINRLQEEFQKDVTYYKDIIDQLHVEINSLRKQNQQLEQQKESIEIQLREKEQELAAKDSMLTDIDAAAVKGGSQLSASDIRSWQVQAAQTNSRLLHVLSDLVKTFLDIEHDINSHLLEYGLIPTRMGSLNHQDDDTGQSVGSREDFASLSFGECPNLELTEDGPDLTPRACDVFIPSGNYETDLEGEDVVLGASRRLRVAVDHVLNLLGRAIENQQSQDLKLLLKRNEELSNELQEESQGRDAVNMELVTAESTVRRLESEKLRLEDLNRDLKDDYDMLKRELNIERSKVSHLQQEKESALDQIHTLKEQCELLSSRLGDPEKTENNKMLNPSGTCLHENSELLEENSKLSSEKHNVQKSLSKERQSFLDRLHQMEIAIEELNAEKDDIMEKKCKEIRDLKAEMEAMEKQLQSNRKFIEQQALEREQEREEFMSKINRMEEFVKEKERIQSSESQMAREIESLEELLRARIEDHKNAMAKKDEVEKELRLSVDKIRDLRDIIDELEKQLDAKSRIEVELRQKLSNLYEAIPNQDKSGSLSDSGDSSKHAQASKESMEHLHNLKERLDSQSQEIEMMSQSQTLLQELRGQIHFLEAKVEQRARQLESSFLSAASSPVQSGPTSPSGSQDSESIQIPCEDGWEMSPRSVHWLEIRRLEEKIGRLAHIDEELLKKNKELEQQLKKMKNSYSECQHENSALQEKLSEQLVQISALKSHIDEQKHRCSTPQKSHPFAEKIEELQEKLEKQIENNKKLISDLQEAESTVKALQDEAHKKEEIIVILQKTVEDKTRHNTSYEEESDFSANEDIKNELEEKVKLLETTKKENEELRSDIEQLKTENSSLKSLLEKSEKEVETERAKVDTLCEDMANLVENSKEGMSDDKTNNTETISEDTQDYKVKLIDMQNRLKAKNLEILMLKATVTKLESSLGVSEKQLEYEKVLVETLQQELGSLTSYQKRLEQDFNTVQNMMQQKERELVTLHEETEAQMKLEAEIEALEKKVSDQKEFEIELREKIEELENQLAVSMDLKRELADKDVYIETITENHKKEIHYLKKKIAVFKNLNSTNENETEIQGLVQRIMETFNAFKSDETNALQEVLINVLKNCINSILKGIKEQHEEHIKSINKSWTEKISEEIESTQKLFKSEIDKCNSEKDKIKSETDEFWHKKIKDIETMLKNEEEKCRKISENAKLTRNELQKMYSNEIATLKHNLDDILKEKNSLEATVGMLNVEIQRLKQIENTQDNKLSMQYDSKLSAFSKTIQESFEKEKNKLQSELNTRLEQEKELKFKHQKELATMHQYFETRWANEMKKIQDSQAEDLRILKSNSEKILEEKLNKAKEEYAVQIAEERKQELLRHKEELSLLQEKHEKEKQYLIADKEKAIKEATSILEKKFNENFKELQKKFASSCQSKMLEEQRKWEEEKLKLTTNHKKQLSALKQELKNRYEKQLQAQSVAHNDEIKRLEETYNKKVDEVNDMIKEAKLAASKTCLSDSRACRTTTPSSDLTSSDEACSSCKEDMLYSNRHILVNKIHDDGKRVLNLIESSTQQYESLKEAHLWLEERKLIVNTLKTVAPATSNGNLKTVIVDLVEEIQKFRNNFEAALDENSDLKKKYEDLEQQLNIQYSKLCDISAQLQKQKSTNLELQSLLSLKTSEVADLKKQLLESKSDRDSQLNAEKGTNPHNNGSIGLSSYEIERLRSVDDPKSAEKFSLFLPEVGNSPPSLDQTTPGSKISYIQDLPSPPKFETPPLLSTLNDNPPDVTDTVKSEMIHVQEKLLSVLNKGIDPTDAKLHGLYWVYRRSQSYNKALIYQKKYLLMLLRSFQGTEKVTLAWLKCMNSDNCTYSPSNEVTISDSPLHPKARFRAVVFVIIALERMKFYVRRWRHLARIPSSHVINVEIQSVFQNYSFLSPDISPGYHHSSQSLSSVTLSMAAKDCKSSQVSTSSRTESKSKNPEKSQLIEYVRRLQILQKQLGLDSLR